MFKKAARAVLAQSLFERLVLLGVKPIRLQVLTLISQGFLLLSIYIFFYLDITRLSRAHKLCFVLDGVTCRVVDLSINDHIGWF